MIATVAIATAIAAYVGWVLWRQVKRRKAGSCSCGCDGCEKNCNG